MLTLGTVSLLSRKNIAIALGVSRNTRKSTTYTRFGRTQTVIHLQTTKSFSFPFSVFPYSSSSIRSPSNLLHPFSSRFSSPFSFPAEVSIFAVLPFRGIIRSVLYYPAKRPFPFSQKDFVECSATISSDNHQIQSRGTVCIHLPAFLAFLFTLCYMCATTRSERVHVRTYFQQKTFRSYVNAAYTRRPWIHVFIVKYVQRINDLSCCV